MREDAPTLCTYTRCAFINRNDNNGETDMDGQILDSLRTSGAEAITSDGAHENALIPLEQKNVVFRQMFEYPVADFEAEVGFYIRVFGFKNIALTDEYALFRHPKHEYCISFRKVDSSLALGELGLKLLFMTTDIPAADAHLEDTGLVPKREILQGSPVQDVIHFSTPAGLSIEIWQMPIEV